MDDLKSLSIEWIKITTSPEETFLLGERIGKALLQQKPQPLLLIGEFGAGKTTLAKGIIQGLTQVSHFEVTSPTFQYASLFYDTTGKIEVAHCDLWRLPDEEEFLNLGLGDLFDTHYFIIEWPEKARSIISQKMGIIPAILADWEDEEKRKYSYFPQYHFYKSR